VLSQYTQLTRWKIAGYHTQKTIKITLLHKIKNPIGECSNWHCLQLLLQQCHLRSWNRKWV